MSFWKQLLVSLGSFTFVAAVIGWLLQTVISHFFTVHLEIFKADLSTLATEREVKFGKLQEKRVEFLTDLYSELEDLDLGLFMLDTALELQERGERDPAEAEKEVASFRRKVLKCRSLFGRKKLYFNATLASQIRLVLNKFDEPLFAVVLTLPGQSPPATLTARRAALRKFKDEQTLPLSQARDALEHEFRRLLGSEP